MVEFRLAAILYLRKLVSHQDIRKKHFEFETYVLLVEFGFERNVLLVKFGFTPTLSFKHFDN